MESAGRVAPVGRWRYDVAVTLGGGDEQIAIDAACQDRAAAGDIRLAQQEPRRRRDDSSDRDRNAADQEYLGRDAQSRASGLARCELQANRPARTEKCRRSPVDLSWDKKQEYERGENDEMHEAGQQVGASGAEGERT